MQWVRQNNEQAWAKLYIWKRSESIYLELWSNQWFLIQVRKKAQLFHNMTALLQAFADSSELNAYGIIEEKKT